MALKRFEEVLAASYPETTGPISDEPDNRGRVPREQCVCAHCGHHKDCHFDGWSGCDVGGDGCECGEYKGPEPIIDPEAYRRFLNMLRKERE